MAMRARVDGFHGKDKDGVEWDKGERRFASGTHPNLCGNGRGSGEAMEVDGGGDTVFALLS